MPKKHLYILMLLACLAGYGWLYLQITSVNAAQEVTVCLFKGVTHVPCPSCGTTRSIHSLLQAEWLTAVMVNPFGYILAAVLLVFPVWIFLDIIRKTDSLLLFYKRSERLLQKKMVAIPAVFLVLMNWIWNIYKGL